MLLRRELPPAPLAAQQGAADKAAIFRRAHLDITGTPPMPADVLIFERQYGGPPESYVNEPVDLPDGKFEFPVHDLDTTYRVLFLDADNRLGAVVDFKGKQAEGEPVTVRLAACGSAKARFVDEQGQPLADYRPLFWTMLQPIHTPSLTELSSLMKDGDPRGPESSMCEVWMGRADPRHYGAGPRTDAEGKITLPCLVAGANYRISQLDGKARDFTVEPGQTVDLGDVRVAKPEQTNKLPVIKPEK